jgi:CxxC-x17-CxxC domain-containing protein
MMKKRIKRKKSSIRPKPEAGPDMMGLISKMTEQLISLEKKIDVLVSRSPSAPSVSSVSSVSSAERRPDHAQRPPERKPENGFRERILHKAVCADCSKECEIPFKPSGGRPVYCKECFVKRKNGAMPPKEKPENPPSERVLVYERSFQKDQAALAPKVIEKNRPAARRRR